MDMPLDIFYLLKFPHNYVACVYYVYVYISTINYMLVNIMYKSIYVYNTHSRPRNNTTDDREAN